MEYQKSHANADPKKTGKGTGQGTRSACTIWGCTSDVTLTAYKKHGTGATFQHPFRQYNQLKPTMLPVYTLFFENYHPVFIDLDATLLFGETSHEIAQPQGQGL